MEVMEVINILLPLEIITILLQLDIIALILTTVEVASHPEYDIASVNFNFWHNLQTKLTRRGAYVSLGSEASIEAERNRRLHIFRPAYGSLVSWVSFRVQYPQEYQDLSREDLIKEFKQTRYVVSELIRYTTSGSSGGVPVHIQDEADLKAVARLFADMGVSYVEFIARGSNETMLMQVCPYCLEFAHQAIRLFCTNNCIVDVCGTPILGHYGCFAKSNLREENARCPNCNLNSLIGYGESPRRQLLNMTTRVCVFWNCGFVGNYQDLLDHVAHAHAGMDMDADVVHPAHLAEMARLALADAITERLELFGVELETIADMAIHHQSAETLEFALALLDQVVPDDD